MPQESAPNLTEKLRRREEQARNDRDAHLKQQRESGNRRDEAATGANPVGGRGNLRERDR